MRHCSPGPLTESNRGEARDEAKYFCKWDASTKWRWDVDRTRYAVGGWKKGVKKEGDFWEGGGNPKKQCG